MTLILLLALVMLVSLTGLVALVREIGHDGYGHTAPPRSHHDAPRARLI